MSPKRHQAIKFRPDTHIPSCHARSYYKFVDRSKMYTIGSLFYAIYFFVSFPMFFRIDEDAPPRGKTWSLGEVAVDGLGASMLVTILLDLWRISLGPVVDTETYGLPWM
eukprot:365661-Chlamydomonas_euryale.AAC.73